MVSIPIWGVILAALSAMVIGWAWYSPMMFGKAWSKSTKITDAEMKKRMPMAMPILIVVSLVTAYVLAHFIIYAHRGTNNGWEEAALKTSLWAWLGFGLTSIFAHGAFKKDKTVLFINAGNRLVTLVVMGAILGAFFK